MLVLLFRWKREVREEEGVHDCRHEPLSMCILWPNLSPFLCIQTCLLRFEHWGVARPPLHHTHHHPSSVCCPPPLLQAWAEEDRWFNLKNILVDRANKLSCLVEPSWSYIFLCCESRTFLSVLLRPQKESKQVSLLEH